MIDRAGVDNEGRNGNEQETNAEIARRNLWEMIMFLVLSICAFAIRDLNLFEMADEPLRQVLGYPPPAYLVSTALAVYCFSAVCLSMTAIARGKAPVSNWNQLGYRSAFYFFYSFSGAIAANFGAVLLVGLGLYALDQYHIWVHSMRTCHGGSPLAG